jgi:hypothetical protein
MWPLEIKRRNIMADVNEKVETLGKTLNEQFNLIAKGNLRVILHIRKLKALGTKGEKLQNELAQELNVPVTTPLETLTGILAAAEAKKLSGTDDLKQAIDLLAKIMPQIPENACPTPDGLQKAVQNAKGKPSP